MFAVFTEKVARDDLRRSKFPLCTTGDSSIVTTVRPLFRFIQTLGCGILPLLKHVSFPPQSGADEVIRPNNLAVHHCTDN